MTWLGVIMSLQILLPQSNQDLENEEFYLTFAN